MQVHPHFAGIVLHSDVEVADLLGAGVVSRKTVHEWPLSCVQELRLHDGRRLVYKSQLPPTVEPEFYECATSPLLPGHRSLGRLGSCATMTLEWIDAPLLKDVAHSADDLVARGREVVAQIGAIRGELPAYLDVGSVAAWTAVVDGVLEKLTELIADGRFRLVDPAVVERLRAWSATAAVRDTILAGPRIAHGDLTPNQIFVTADGYRVIDWQRPVLGPPDLDLVSLLAGAEHDPRRYLPGTVIGAFWFLRLHWAVVAQHDLFPEHRWPVYDQWSAGSIARILS